MAFRHHLGRRAGQCRPALMRRLQEAQVGRVVHRSPRCWSMILGGDRLVPGGARRLEQHLAALRHLGAGLPLAAHQELARRMGIGEAEITHIRRGVLLHDIGKMGVPDHILRKTGPLNDEEWKEMRQHPQYAYDLLHPIAYLRPALDIPYGHHEKWDGTGYPRGLKGTEIPLSARIFAVVDVWDALLSDRPYRPSWTRQETIDYIRKEAGTRFDPNVVKVFLDMVANQE